MSAIDDIREGLAEAFNTLNPEFFPNDSAVSLLKQNTSTREFDTIETISANWFLEYSEFRGNFLLQIAEHWSLTDSIREATHVQVGDDVYVIRRGDTIEPKGQPTWKLFCEKFAERGQYSNLY